MSLFCVSVPSRLLNLELFPYSAGSYQWTLLSLCGFGESPARRLYMFTQRAMNLVPKGGWRITYVDSAKCCTALFDRHAIFMQMWIQAVAVILPRVQQHFDGEPSFRLLYCAAAGLTLNGRSIY